jgi:surface antigen
MKPAVRALIFAAVSLALAQSSLAKKNHDRHDDEDDRQRRNHGPYTKFENNEHHYRYEYSDRSCRYKYEYNYRNGKTKVHQKGDCRGIAFQHPVAQGREPLPRAIPPQPQARAMECNREVIGAVLGGAAGAVIGSQVGERDERFITTVGGAVIGAVVGGAIGKSMDDADQACAAQALEYANLKQSVRWHNKARGSRYTITPVGLVPAEGRGFECRRYSLLTEAGGRQQNSGGVACRQRDGSWRLST